MSGFDPTSPFSAFTDADEVDDEITELSSDSTFTLPPNFSSLLYQTQTTTLPPPTPINPQNTSQHYPQTPATAPIPPPSSHQATSLPPSQFGTSFPTRVNPLAPSPSISYATHPYTTISSVPYATPQQPPTTLTYSSSLPYSPLKPAPLHPTSQSPTAHQIQPIPQTLSHQIQPTSQILTSPHQIQPTPQTLAHQIQPTPQTLNSPHQMQPSAQTTATMQQMQTAPQIPTTHQTLPHISPQQLAQLQEQQKIIVQRLQQIKLQVQQIQTQQPNTGEGTTQIPPGPIPLISGKPTPTQPVPPTANTLLPVLLQQQQALIQKYQTSQAILQQYQQKPVLSAATIQQQKALILQKLQAVQQQIQMATKLTPTPIQAQTTLLPTTPTAAIASSLTTDIQSLPPTASPTLLALQQQQNLLLKQFQQLNQLQAKQQVMPSSSSPSPSPLPPTNLATPSSTITLPTNIALMKNVPPSSPSSFPSASPSFPQAPPLSLSSSLNITLSSNHLTTTAIPIQPTTNFAPSMTGIPRTEITPTPQSSAAISSSSSSTLSSTLSSSSADVTWSLQDQVKLQRALVKYGTNFSVLSTALGTKSSGQVRKFYHQTGGAKGSYRYYLAEHHRLKKHDGVLDNFSLDLTHEEEELVKQGKIPEPPNTGDQTPPPEMLDGESPLDGMDDDQRKEYKRKRAEQIFIANERGIFQTNEEGETEVPSPKKPKRPPKLTPSAHSAMPLPSPRANATPKGNN